MSTEDIHDMLRRLGIGEAAERGKAIVALREAGVISARPNRSGTASSKETAVVEALHNSFLWHCRRGNCQREAAASGKSMLLVAPEFCATAGHSPRQALLAELGETLQTKGLRNLLLVGGTEEYWREIRIGSPDTLSWRFVDGKAVKDDRYYKSHKDWADLTVIWASTPLNHKVSQKFPSAGDRRVITAPGRGMRQWYGTCLKHSPQPIGTSRSPALLFSD